MWTEIHVKVVILTLSLALCCIQLLLSLRGFVHVHSFSLPVTVYSILYWTHIKSNRKNEAYEREKLLKTNVECYFWCSFLSGSLISSPFWSQAYYSDQVSLHLSFTFAFFLMSLSRLLPLLGFWLCLQIPTVTLSNRFWMPLKYRFLLECEFRKKFDAMDIERCLCLD